MKKASNILLRILGILLLIPSAWEEKAHDLDTILQKMTIISKNWKIAIFVGNKSTSSLSILKEGGSNGQVNDKFGLVVFVKNVLN